MVFMMNIKKLLTVSFALMLGALGAEAATSGPYHESMDLETFEGIDPVHQDFILQMHPAGSNFGLYGPEQDDQLLRSLTKEQLASAEAYDDLDRIIRDLQNGNKSIAESGELIEQLKLKADLNKTPYFYGGNYISSIYLGLHECSYEYLASCKIKISELINFLNDHGLKPDSWEEFTNEELRKFDQWQAYVKANFETLQARMKKLEAEYDAVSYQWEGGEPQQTTAEDISVVLESDSADVNKPAEIAEEDEEKDFYGWELYLIE